MTGTASSGSPLSAIHPLRPPDQLLAGRHRLAEAEAVGADATLWRAIDEVLGRTVAVKVLDAGDRSAAAALVDAAKRASQLSHPNVARVYDAAADDQLAVVVSEWVDGVALSRLLRDGPLPADQVHRIAGQVAQALTAAHRVGIRHGRLHPDNVLVSTSGLVKVTDLEVAAAVHRAAVDPAAVDPAARLGLPLAPGAGLGPGTAGECQDVRALGALMYAMLTGKWPPRAAFGLRAAPRVDGRLCSPRQVRAGVPRDLDMLVMRILGPGRTAASMESLTEVLAAVRQASSATATGRDVPAVPPGVSSQPEHRRSGPLLRIALPLSLVACVGAGGWLAGLSIGAVPGPDAHFPSLSAPSPPAPIPASAPAPTTTVAPIAVRGFNPEGDGPENADKVALATDGDPSTAWETQTYRGRPDFGGLKSGTGLLVDLGKPTTLRSVRLLLTQPGASIELRAADLAGQSAADYPVVAAAEDASAALTLVPAVPTTARYWLVWIRRLPGSGRGFREGIAEMEFRT